LLIIVVFIQLNFLEIPSFTVVFALSVADTPPTEFLPRQPLRATNRPSFFLASLCGQRIDCVFSLPAVAGTESTEFLPRQRLLTPNRPSFFLASGC